MGKRGWVLVGVLLLLILATTRTALAPPGGTCLNTLLDPGEVCDRTASPTGCPDGYTCNSQCTLCSNGQHTCNNNGVCDAGEVYPCDTCPAPCIPNCQGHTCGLDPVCHTQSCGSCGTNQTCVSGQCCTPTTCSANPATTPCGQTATGTTNCGTNCTITGTLCSDPNKPYCSGGACVACTNADQCNDNNMCTDDACNAGVCAHVNNAVPCTPAGGGNGVCSGGVCAPVCGQGLTTCGASCVNLSIDPNNCGACGNVCATGATCVNNACVCQTTCASV